MMMMMMMYLFPSSLLPHAPQSFSSAMATVATSASRLVPSMGQAGRAHVAAKFSRDAFGAQLNRICTELQAKMTAKGNRPRGGKAAGREL